MGLSLCSILICYLLPNCMMFKSRLAAKFSHQIEVLKHNYVNYLFFFFKCHIKTNVNFNIAILPFLFLCFLFSRNSKHIGEELWKSAWLPSSLPLKFSKFKKKEEKAVWLIKFSLCPSLPVRKSRKRKPVSIVAATPVRMREVGERSVQLMCIPRSIVWKCHPDCCSNNTTASYWKRAGQTASPMCYVFFIYLF